MIIKHDSFKSRLDLLPVDALELVGFVMRAGAKKYREHGWKDCKDPSRYVRPILAHTLKHVKGEYTDKESGLLHLAHAVASGLIALDLFFKLGHNAKMERKQFSYFAILEKKSKKRGVVLKRFRSYEAAWKHLDEHKLEPSKFQIQTVRPADKVGQIITL